jgi:hypothetical protein
MPKTAPKPYAATRSSAARTWSTQQMRWSRRGADLLLQVRCAVVNGKLGSGLGHLFKTEADSASGLAMAA